MTEPNETLRQRLRELVDASGKSPRGISLEIGANHSYVSQVIRGRGGVPSAERLHALAEALGTSVDYLLGSARSPAQVESEVSLAEHRASGGQPRANGPGIPLVGTGDCADLLVTDTSSGEPVEVERSSFDPDFHVRYIERPAALRGAPDIYAIYFHGQSMEPRFEAGDVGLVDPLRPPRPGDYVLVQLNAGDSDDVVSVLAKRLVRQTAREVELEQFNPPLVFSIPKTRVQRIHRIMPPTELLL